MAGLPTFDQLKKNYPTGDGSQVKAKIGGGVTGSWLGENTCVIRMSKAFNHASGRRFAIPGTRAGLVTVKGADKLNYAIRVTEFIDFLTHKYGAANIIKTGEAIEEKTFLGKTGIIAWNVNGWANARGHFTLWDGHKGLYVGGLDYWALPKKPPTDGKKGAYLVKSQLWLC
jgi:hypothetical protein